MPLLLFEVELAWGRFRHRLVLELEPRQGAIWFKETFISRTFSRSLYAARADSRHRRYHNALLFYVHPSADYWRILTLAGMEHLCKPSALAEAPWGYHISLGHVVRLIYKKTKPSLYAFMSDFFIQDGHADSWKWPLWKRVIAR